MLTDTLESQTAFVQAALNLNLNVVGLELGNEFYNNDADYVKVRMHPHIYAM